MVFGTTDRYKTTTTQLSPGITARYIKIVPKLWNIDGHACTKLEVLGCSTDEGETSKQVVITLHCISLYYIVRHWSLYFTVSHCIVLHYILFHCIALHCIALHVISFHCIALHCIAT